MLALRVIGSVGLWCKKNRIALVVKKCKHMNSKGNDGFVLDIFFLSFYNSLFDYLSIRHEHLLVGKTNCHTYLGIKI